MGEDPPAGTQEGVSDTAGPQGSQQAFQQQDGLKNPKNLARALSHSLNVQLHGAARMCQVDGCGIDLFAADHLKAYHRRNRICSEHVKISSAMVNGKMSRYCQQCHKCHVLEAFDGDRRSCRATLQKRAAKLTAATSTASGSTSPGVDTKKRSAQAKDNSWSSPHMTTRRSIGQAGDADQDQAAGSDSEATEIKDTSKQRRYDMEVHSSSPLSFPSTVRDAADSFLRQRLSDMSSDRSVDPRGAGLVGGMDGLYQRLSNQQRAFVGGTWRSAGWQPASRDSVANMIPQGSYPGVPLPRAFGSGQPSHPVAAGAAGLHVADAGKPLRLSNSLQCAMSETWPDPRQAGLVTQQHVMSDNPTLGPAPQDLLEQLTSTQQGLPKANAAAVGSMWTAGLDGKFSPDGSMSLYFGQAGQGLRSAFTAPGLNLDDTAADTQLNVARYAAERAAADNQRVALLRLGYDTTDTMLLQLQQQQQQQGATVWQQQQQRPSSQPLQGFAQAFAVQQAQPRLSSSSNLNHDHTHNIHHRYSHPDASNASGGQQRYYSGVMPLSGDCTGSSSRVPQEALDSGLPSWVNDKLKDDGMVRIRQAFQAQMEQGGCAVQQKARISHDKPEPGLATRIQPQEAHYAIGPDERQLLQRQALIANNNTDVQGAESLQSLWMQLVEEDEWHM